MIKSQLAEATIIRFNALPYVVGKSTIIKLPEEASEKLSSRGQVSVKGTLNEHEFTAVLEPDGRWGHWLRIDTTLQKSADVHAGETVEVKIKQVKDWPEPIIPEDLSKTLSTAPEKVQNLWKTITPMARWEWVRWVNATNNQDTRNRRVEVSISKMQSGKRRPCCFNLAACTDPELSKNGRLLEPETAV